MAGDGSLIGVVIMVATVLLQSQASTPGLHGLIDVEPPMVRAGPSFLALLIEASEVATLEELDTASNSAAVIPSPSESRSIQACEKGFECAR